MYIEKIKSIAEYEYCSETYFEGTDEIMWTFGWKDGIHFYLSIFSGDYFVLNAWQDKQLLLAWGDEDFNAIYNEITSTIRSIKK